MKDAHGFHLLEAIGVEGLRAAIRDTFDRARLVELANACRLKFPGKRAQSVDDAHLRDALVKGFLEEEHVRPPLMKALARANAGESKRVAALSPEELSEWCATLSPGACGRGLFAVAFDQRDAARKARETLKAALASASPEAPAPSPAPAGPEAGPGGQAVPNPRPASAATPADAPTGGTPVESPRRRRLAEEVALLRERLDKAEASRTAQSAVLDEMREREAAHQQEIVAARKDVHHLRREIAQAESERNRLREENLLLAARVEERGSLGESARRIEEMSVRLHQLQREHKKVAHDLDELLRARPPSGDAAMRPYLDALAASVEAVRRDLADLKRHVDEESHRTIKSFQELAAETRMIRSDIAQWRKAFTEPVPRRRGELERVGLFVDVQNMYYAARQLNSRLDFGTLMSTTTRNRRLIRAIAYVVQNRDIDQSGFLAMLQQKNYEVRRKDLKIRTDGSSKGDWDMEMALDILRLAESLDVVVLVSGDGDFASLVTQIKTLGPKVEVYSFPGSTAKELIEAADRHVPIDEGFLIRMSPSG